MNAVGLPPPCFEAAVHISGKCPLAPIVRQ
jgi:hypothetical protein